MFAGRLKEIMRDRKLGVFTLAYESGVHPNTILNILSGGNTRAGTIARIARALDVPTADLIDDSHRDQYIAAVEGDSKPQPIRV